MRPFILFVALALALAATVVSAPVRAQTPAVLEVTVLDPSGLVLPGARVTIVETGAEAVTDETGRARLTAPPPGLCTVVVSAEHFQAVTESVRVGANATTSTAVAFAVVRSRDTQIDVVGEERAVVQQIPGSVELLSRREIQASHTADANELLRRVPGLTVREDSGPAGMRLNIGVRGLNPDRSRQILVLEDGLPLALAPYGEPEMYYSPPIERMARIEVVKGSGSILFGPQTIGGVVNFVTPDPPSRSRTAIDLTAGQRGLFVGQASYGTTKGRMGVFASGLRKQGDGLRRFEFGINDLLAKVTYAVTPRQSLGVKLNAYHEASNSTYLGLTQLQFDADPNQNAVPDDRLRVRRIFGSLHHRLVVGKRAVLTTTGFVYDTQRFWRRQDYDRQPALSRSDVAVAGDATVPGGAVYLRGTSSSRDREFRVAGVESRVVLDHEMFGARHGLEAGARYLYERAIDRNINWAAVTGGTAVLRDLEERPAHAVSMFAQNRVFLGDRITITPGLRIERYAYKRHILRKRVNGVPTSVDISAGDGLTELIPGIGATAQANGLTWFAGAHRGFAPPRVKDAITSSGESLELDAERSWNYEAGVRWAPDPGFSAQATFFALDFSNQIIPAAQSGGATTTLVNGGQTLHRGIEFAAASDLGALRRPVTGLTAELRYTYLPTARFESGLYEGNRLPYAPRHAASLILGYRSRAVTVQLDGTLLRSQFGDNLETIAGSPDGTVGRLPSYVIWNVSIERQVRRGKFQIAPFVTVKNLANRIYISSRAPDGIQPGPFRQLNAGVRAVF